ncbi:MAG: hypothetical protein N4A35_10880 [Flavobacteriales bacterium]|jgi:hypothetical protein|nr:hypothetical protein [Flavobacteriales bacterium]
MKKSNIIRLITGAIIGASFMLLLFYIWHGVVLNDLSFLQYDQNIFIGLLSLVYLSIAFALSFVIAVYNPEQNRFFKHLSIGVFMGFLIYLIVFVLGISFNGGGIEHIVLDLSWQMLEQMLGSGVVSIYYLVSYRLDKLRKMESFD